MLLYFRWNIVLTQNRDQCSFIAKSEITNTLSFFSKFLGMSKSHLFNLKYLHITSQVKWSGSDPVGSSSTRRDPVGRRRNPRCRNPIGFSLTSDHRNQANVPVGFRQRGFRRLPTGSCRISLASIRFRSDSDWIRRSESSTWDSRLS
jgi:hypothetical protein